MNNASKNRRFLDSVDEETRVNIIGNIAKHYGETPENIIQELTIKGAEHLLDYVTVDRPIIHLMMVDKGCF